MNILVTNDDGIGHPGLWALVNAVKDLGNVTVVAPATNQSGVGPALSFRKSVRINDYESRADGVPAYAVPGTPGDCVVLGIKHVLAGDVDAVVSGINPGANTSRNMFISGTFGAAVIAAANGVKTAAFSMGPDDDMDDRLVNRIITGVTGELVSPDTPAAGLYNVNFPSLLGPGIRGAEGCAPARSEFQVKLDAKPDGGFEILSRLAVQWNGSKLEPGTDVEVLDRGMVALTAVSGYDLQTLGNDPSLQRMIAAASSAIG